MNRTETSGLIRTLPCGPDVACPVCGAGTTLNAPEGVPIAYACGYTAEHIRQGKHRVVKPIGPGVVVGVALVIAAVLWTLTESPFSDGIVTFDEQILHAIRALRVAVVVIGLFILYALWRIIHLLSRRPAL